MQKKEKKYVDFAETKKERIIVYSNNYEDDKYLVAENSGGEIKIFFEKENEESNKNIEIKANENSEVKMQGILYFMLCNLVYIIWLVVNYTLFSSMEVKTIQITTCMILSMLWLIIFFILFRENKYANNIIVLLTVSIIINNLFIYFEKSIFIFVVIVVYAAFIMFELLKVFLKSIIEYVLLYKYERKNFEEKSKHSVEHIMCNYIEKYQIYAKNVKELKKCSRFSIECGGIYGDKIFEKNSSQIISNSLIMIILMRILSFFSVSEIFMPKDIPEALDITAIFMGAFVVIWLLTDIFSSQICNLLIIFSQCFTTLPKRKIKYKDLKMAQLLSKKFVEWQYPDDIEPKKKTE